MSKIKLKFARLSVTQKVAKAQQIVAALSGNPDFPSPLPALPAVTAAIDDLNAAFATAKNARQTAKEKTTSQHKKEEVLDRIISQLTAYVESVAVGNDALILSAGMDVRASPVLSTAFPEQPQALAATTGDHDGEIDLTWEAVTGARSYVIDKSGDPVTTWNHAGVSTRASFTAKGLTSGTRHWFRVAAVNHNGQSGWSDPATAMAP